MKKGTTILILLCGSILYCLHLIYQAPHKASPLQQHEKNGGKMHIVPSPELKVNPIKSRSPIPSKQSDSALIKLLDDPDSLDIHLFVIWHDALKKEREIISDIEKLFMIVEIKRFRWIDAKEADKKKNEVFLNNLWRLYSGKGGWMKEGMKMKVKQCGKGEFTALIVIDPNPFYREEKTAHGKDHVNHNMNAAKAKYRRLTGGGFRVHGTFNKGEARHDILLLFHHSLDHYSSMFISSAGEVSKTIVKRYWEEMAARPQGNPSVTSQHTFGFDRWENCEDLQTALQLFDGVGFHSISDPNLRDLSDCHEWPFEFRMTVPGKAVKWSVVSLLNGNAIDSATNPSSFSIMIGKTEHHIVVDVK